MAIDKAKLLKSAEKNIASGKVSQAIDDYLKILKEYPKDWNLMIQVGDLYLKINKTPDAIQYFQKVADHYYADGFFLKAIAIFKRINKLDPSLTDICMKLADLYLKQGLSMDAKSQLQVVAQNYISKNQTKEAIQTFKKLIEIEPDNLRTRNELAKAYKNEGMVGDAVREYSEISDQLTRKGLLKESLTVLETAYKLDPRNTMILRKILVIYSEQKEIAKASALMEETLLKDPSNPEVLALLAETYAVRNQFARAHETIDLAIEKSPEKEPLVVLKGDLYLQQGNFDDAFAQYSMVIDDMMDRDEGEKAVVLLQRITRLDASFHPALQKLIDIYSEMNQESNMLASYSSLVDAYISKASYNEAATYLEKLISFEPENVQHQEKLEFVRSFLDRPGASLPETIKDFEIAREVPQEIRETDFGAAPAVGASSKRSALMDDKTLVSKRGGLAKSVATAGQESGEEDKDFVSEHLIEAEVFSKYGLIDKAVEQLQIITLKYPGSVLAHQKLKEIYLEKGERDKAVEACVTMSRIFRRRGDLDQAEDLLSEARQISPNHPALEKAYQEMPQASEEVEETMPAGGDARRSEAVSKSRALTPEISEEIEIEIEEPAEIIAPPAEPKTTLEKEDFEEIDFYSSQGLTSEARKLLDQLKERYPNDPGVLDRLSNLEEEAPLPLQEQEVVVEIPLEEVDESELSELSLNSVKEEVPIALVEDSNEEAITIDLEEPSSEGETLISVEEAVSQNTDVQPEASDTENAGNWEGQAVEAETGLTRADVSSEQRKEINASPGKFEQEVEEEPTESRAEERIFEPVESGTPEIEAESHEELSREVQPEKEGEEYGEPTEFAELEDVSSSLQSNNVQINPAESAHDSQKETVSESPSTPFQFEEKKISHPQAVPASAGILPEEDEDYFDLAAELEEGLLNVQSAVEEDKPADGHLYSLEEILTDFKKGVEKQLGAEDYDTHYNLGIAFKEMGLIDEAIAEFQVAAKDEKKLLECCSMLGLCFVEKGMPKLALKWYQRGLDSAGHSEEEYFGLKYEMAQAHEAAGDEQLALDAYLEVYSANAGYRNVAKRVKELREKSKKK